MKKTVIIFFVVAFFVIKGKGQSPHPTGMDVTIHGYIFLTESGLFFQPLDYYQYNKPFVSSLDKISFKIEETRQVMYSDVLKGVGNKLIVKNYTNEFLQKNPTLKASDTIYNFKCSIDISLNYFDKETKVDSIGYGFFIKDSLISYGNLYIRNQLLRIIPDDVKVLKQFYNSYSKIKWIRPEWLEKLYREKVLMHKH